MATKRTPRAKPEVSTPTSKPEIRTPAQPGAGDVQRLKAWPKPIKRDG